MSCSATVLYNKICKRHPIKGRIKPKCNQRKRHIFKGRTNFVVHQLIFLISGVNIDSCHRS